ncbi:MAG: hypothetical protein HOB79_17410 [Rhodospirillaceae bacterium]|nr:hypothetical protein [Rhodospirillales bacterium]MBT4702851.1 hypothetical protein [Rhodospirillaceae bacterium]
MGIAPQVTDPNKQHRMIVAIGLIGSNRYRRPLSGAKQTSNSGVAMSDFSPRGDTGLAI